MLVEYAKIKFPSGGTSIVGISCPPFSVMGASVLKSGAHPLLGTITASLYVSVSPKQESIRNTLGVVAIAGENFGMK